MTFAGGGAAINRTYDIVSASRSSGFDWFGTARVRLGWAIDRTLILRNRRLAFASGGDRNNNFGFDLRGGFGGALQQQRRRLAHRMDDRRRCRIRLHQQPDGQDRGPVGEP